MLITDIATFTREQTGVTSVNVTDTQLYRYLNIAYHEIEDAIVQDINEDYFWNEMTFSLVANQGEYTLDTAEVWQLSGTKKLLGVAVDFDWTGNYVDCTKTTGENRFEKRSDTPSSDPLYTIMDWSIEIFPTPLVSRTNGGKQFVVQNLKDLSSGTLETEIFNGKINKMFHNLIAFGAMEHIYRQRKLENEAKNARQVFLTKLYWDKVQDLGLIGRLDNRSVEPLYSKQPNTNRFN